MIRKYACNLIFALFATFLLSGCNSARIVSDIKKVESPSYKNNVKFRIVEVILEKYKQSGFIKKKKPVVVTPRILVSNKKANKISKDLEKSLIKKSIALFPNLFSNDKKAIPIHLKINVFHRSTDKLNRFF